MKSWFILSLSGSRSYSNRMIGPMNLFLVKWKSVNWKEKRRAKKTWTENANKQVIAPGAARRYARRRWQFDSRRIYVRSRTDPQSAHLWWRAVAKLQAASVPIAQSSCNMQQTEGRITVSRNAPPLRRVAHNNISRRVVGATSSQASFAAGDGLHEFMLSCMPMIR